MNAHQRRKARRAGHSPKRAPSYARVKAWREHCRTGFWLFGPPIARRVPRHFRRDLETSR